MRFIYYHELSLPFCAAEKRPPRKRTFSSRFSVSYRNNRRVAFVSGRHKSHRAGIAIYRDGIRNRSCVPMPVISGRFYCPSDSVAGAAVARRTIVSITSDNYARTHSSLGLQNSITPTIAMLSYSAFFFFFFHFLTTGRHFPSRMLLHRLLVLFREAPSDR